MNQEDTKMKKENQGSSSEVNHGMSKMQNEFSEASWRIDYDAERRKDGHQVMLSKKLRLHVDSFCWSDIWSHDQHSERYSAI